MARTTINFEYEGKEYSLAYTIDTLKRLENSGFSFGNIDDHIITATEDLFVAAFNAHHKDVPNKKRREIYSELCAEGEDGDTLLDALLSMVNECLDAMKPKGNAKWRRTQE